MGVEFFVCEDGADGDEASGDEEELVCALVDICFAERGDGEEGEGEAVALDDDAEHKELSEELGAFLRDVDVVDEACWVRVFFLRVSGVFPARRSIDVERDVEACPVEEVGAGFPEEVDGFSRSSLVEVKHGLLVRKEFAYPVENGPPCGCRALVGSAVPVGGLEPVWGPALVAEQERDGIDDFSVAVPLADRGVGAGELYQLAPKHPNKRHELFPVDTDAIPFLCMKLNIISDEERAIMEDVFYALLNFIVDRLAETAHLEPRVGLLVGNVREFILDMVEKKKKKTSIFHQ